MRKSPPMPDCVTWPWPPHCGQGWGSWPGSEPFPEQCLQRSVLLKERFSSDQTTALICSGCGYLADPYLFNYRSKCPVCNSSKFDRVELAYAFKLFMNELRSMGINPSFGTKDRFFEEK